MGLMNLFGGETKPEKDFPYHLSDAEWRAKLTPEQYQVLRGHGTERPGSCALNYEKRAGNLLLRRLRPENSSSPARSSRAAPAGRASTSRWRGAVEDGPRTAAT